MVSIIEVCIGSGGGHLPDGLAVRIPGFHPGGPGSTPGQGANFFALHGITPPY